MYTPNGECCEVSVLNTLPELFTREADQDAETSEEDAARLRTPRTLFASKQEAGGRSCLFPCRCRSCFRELPLTSTPGVSSPLWHCAPTPVRHFFPLLPPPHILHVGQAWPCRPAPPWSVPMHLQRAELPARTHRHTHAHRDTLLRLLLQASTESFTLAGRLVEFKKRTFSSALEIPK